MQRRRSHKKSRRGCQNCKKWHVKCDERTPRCTTCTLRSATCVYTWAPPGGAHNGDSDDPNLILRTKLESPSDGESSTSSSMSGVPSSMPSSVSESRRFLELELMHQFSSSTYRSLCGIDEDHYYIQCMFPRESLEHRFPLDGIFALAALEVAVYCDSEDEANKYVNAAQDYYLRAVVSLREKLQDHSPEIHHLVYMLSAVINVINIALPGVTPPGRVEHQSVLERMLIVFTLLNGSRSIAQVNINAIINGPMPMRTLMAIGPAPPEMIDPSSKAAIARLNAINDELYSRMPPPDPTAGVPRATTRSSSSSSTSPPNSGTVANPGLLGDETPHEAYRKAIFYLEHCYAEDARNLKRGYCPTFSGLAGHAFAVAIKRKEPMALLILMHWAVLLHRLDTGVYWYARGIGQRLVVEIATLLDTAYEGASAGCPAPYVALTWRQSMDWVRQQVDLPVGL